MSTTFGSQDESANRRASAERSAYSGPERRQFRDSHESANPEVSELAQAVDQYKLNHRRRFITYEELYNVMAGLGYKKVTETAAVDAV